MDFYQVLQKAEQILTKVNNDEDFHIENAGSLISFGERTVDYCAYSFDISEDYSLIISFVDFGLEDFSIVCKKQKEEIDQIFNQ